jgi:hypothetical protein
LNYTYELTLKVVPMVNLLDLPNDHVLAGWEMSVTVQLRTPLKWLQRHREFHAGAVRPDEELPPEHACWVPVTKTWRAIGIDIDEIPETMMASQVGQIPVDGGDFLPFLMEYRMIVEGAADALGALGKRHPQYVALLADPPRTRPRKGVRT